MAAKRSAKLAAEPAPPPAPATPRMGLAELLDMMADALVERIVPRLAARAHAREELCDQLSAPCERRQYLEAARRGAFPSYRRGKRVFARRTDVMAWLTTEGPKDRKRVAPQDLAPVGGYTAIEDDVRRALGLKRTG